MLIANPDAPMVRARKLAEFGGVMLMVAVVAVVASAGREHLANPVLEAMDVGLAPSAVAINALSQSVLALPSVFLILSLLDLRAALTECFFTPAAGRALKHAGAWALMALAAKIVLAPTLHGLFAPAPLGLVVTYESFDLGLIGFAALLMLAGSVLETATSRSDEFA